MADFTIAYTPLKRFEGGWCNIANDAGGETYAGISRTFWPLWKGWRLIDALKAHESFTSGNASFSAYLATVEPLNELVAAFYQAEWWEPMHLSCLPQAVANEIFEQAVNLGRKGCVRYVQRLCNAMNYCNGVLLFEDLIEDGIIGKKTLSALNDVLTYWPAEEVLHALNALQATHYITLASRNSSQRRFLCGWLTRTTKLHLDK